MQIFTPSKLGPMGLRRRIPTQARPQRRPVGSFSPLPVFRGDTLQARDRFHRGLRGFGGVSLPSQPTNTEGWLDQIIETEGFPEQAKNSSLLQARADFEMAGDLDAFNGVLRRRASLSDDPAGLADYDAMVETLVAELPITLAQVEVSSSDRDQAVPLVREEEPVSDSLRYLLAGQLVDLYGERPEILQEMLDSDLSLVATRGDLTKPDGSQVGGLFDKETNTAFFNLRSSQLLMEQQLGGNLFLHEVTHAVDFDHATQRGDGLLPGLTDQQRQQYTQLRTEVQTSLSQDGFQEPLDYAATDQFEFLAATVEHFYANPYRLDEVSPDLYGFYRDYFDIDPKSFVDPSTLDRYKDFVAQRGAQPHSH